MNKPIITLEPGDWERHADEAAHYTAVRNISPLSLVFEVVRVTHEKHGEMAEFVHQVVFMEDYTEEEFARILKGFGYESLDAFVEEMNFSDADPSSFVKKPDGTIDRDASPGWFIDYSYMANMIAEAADGLILPVSVADAKAERILQGGLV